MNAIEKIKFICREGEIPFFAEGEIEGYLALNNGDVDKTIYDCLIVKSENSTISVSGLTTQDTSSYFRRLADQYKPNNSGILGG